MTLRRRLLACAALACSLLALPAAAQAIVVIDGSPLNVHLGDTGRMQARFDGQTNGEFFSPTSDEGNAGLHLGVDIGTPSAQTAFFASGGPQQPVTGSGTAADPFRQVTTLTASIPSQQGQSIVVTQTAEYVNGQSSFKLRYEIASTSATATTVRPALFADLTVAGSDTGTGVFEAGPPRFIGGFSTNFDGSSGTGGILELTPWKSFESGQLGTVSSHANDTTPDNSQGFTNTASPENVDNAVGVQWSDVALVSGSPYVVEASWRFSRFQALAIDPEQGSSAVGTTHTITARAQSGENVPAAGVPILFQVTGPNSRSGSVTTGADGTSRITYRGTNAGTDSVQVTRDTNGNGVADPGEPQRSATVEWLQPQVGRTAVVEPVRGTVLVKLPRGARAASYGLHARDAQAGGFIPLSQATTLPVRTLVNTNRGEISLSSARDLRGRTQTANFYSGTFQIAQRRARRPITEMLLKGGSFRRCAARRGKGASHGPQADASARRGRRVRRLWGRGRGRFRTRGRYSSATVRGTTWLVEDHCNGTLTRVARKPRTNRVVVRDFVRRRSVTLRAGRSYFAAKRGL